MESDPDECKGGEVLTTGNQYISSGGHVPHLSSLDGRTGDIILKDNLSLNDNQHRRRIKSMLPEDYVSNTSSTTSTPAIESNEQENNERNSAYETIQAKIRAAAEAKKKSNLVSEEDDPNAQIQKEDNTTQATSQALK